MFEVEGRPEYIKPNIQQMPSKLQLKVGVATGRSKAEIMRKMYLKN